MERNINKVNVYFFVLISFILYILFIFYPNNVPVILLEYIGILICFGFSFLINNHTIDTWLVRIGLFFTAIADLFLLVLTGYEVTGVLFFCIVQLIYGVRLLFMDHQRVSFHQSIQIRLGIIFFIELIGLLILSEQDLLSFITFFYFANLLTNVIFAVFNYHKNRLFAIGLFLFMCCDLFVGLNNSQEYLNLSSESIWSKLINLPIDLMWFFYFPSQVLITLSILSNRD